MQPLKIGFALCGSFCTIPSVLEKVEQTAREGYDIFPIMSETAAKTDTRFGKASDIVARLEKLSGRQVISSIREAEPIGPQKMFDVLCVAPCTGNTLAKLASGITDSSVTMAVKAHLRNGRPVLLSLSTNDALGASAQNIGKLMPRKNIFFVPFSQDDPEGKPASMTADIDLLFPAIEAAARGEQLRPVIK